MNLQNQIENLKSILNSYSRLDYLDTDREGFHNIEIDPVFGMDKHNLQINASEITSAF